MQLASIASQPAPIQTRRTPIDPRGVELGTGHWRIPDGPAYASKWFTDGASLGDWRGLTEALEGARALSLELDAPVAITATATGNVQNPFLHHVFRITTATPLVGDGTLPDVPTHLVTTQMLRPPAFQGFTATTFGVVAILDRGENINQFRG